MYLNGHSYYSYKYGILSLEELVQYTLEKGYTHLALSDVNSSSGWVDLIRFSEKHGLSPSLGIDFRNSAEQCYVGIAVNEEGRHELNRFLSEHLMEKKDFPDRTPYFEHAIVVYPFNRIGHFDFAQCPLLVNEYIGLAPEDLNRFRFSKLGKQFLSEDRAKIVLLHTATFRNKRDFNTHRLLRAMDKNTLLSMLPSNEQGKESDRMWSREELEKHFEESPWILENTQTLLEKTNVDTQAGFAPREDGQHLNLQCYSGSKEEDERLIRALCEAGLPYRYPQASPEVHARVEKELNIIIRQGFVSYFLINWDIVNYARKQGYFYVGRGSGANSVVAYLLRITDVDPIELDLYFERFINLFRSTPPDFDMDFSWADREDITRYIFERFPTACLLGAYSTFQFRAARRELGKVFG
ncbi:MAG: DNA polymerase III subunit alpha, partial [Flavobacteriales bacterium]|nr:DNA polymerase III subunit alpha [Flavobacteriales bacterium]